MTRSHIDIYTSSASQPLPPRLTKHPHTQTLITSPVPPAHPLARDWNLTSLENSTFHSAYHPLFEIDEFMYQLQAEHPDLVRLVPLGHTGQGREMVGMTISREENKPPGARAFTAEKMSFVITGAQHAREVSPRPFVACGHY
jgi:hypothetical protein